MARPWDTAALRNDLAWPLTSWDISVVPSLWALLFNNTNPSEESSDPPCSPLVPPPHRDAPQASGTGTNHNISEKFHSGLIISPPAGSHDVAPQNSFSCQPQFTHSGKHGHHKGDCRRSTRQDTSFSPAVKVWMLFSHPLHWMSLPWRAFVSVSLSSCLEGGEDSRTATEKGD